MQALDKLCQFLTQALAWIAGFFLVAIVFLTCSNIFFRITWKPVMGAVELMGYFGAIVTAFALGYTQMKGGNVSVDLFVQRFPRKHQKILTGINQLICMIFFVIVSWQIAKFATKLLTTGEVTETLRIIYYPFTYGAAIGCVFLSFVFLTEFLKSLLGKEEDR
ncbi:MAG: TRAP transporter small permease [Pseudomonadota bacterium]